MVPLFAAVIIAGLGIGALLSAFAARHAPAPPRASPAIVVHTPTPPPRVAAVTTPQPTIEPPSPSPSVAATNAPTPNATVTATPSPARTTSSKPTAAPSKAPAAPPSRRPVPQSTSKVVSQRATTPPAPLPTAVATQTQQSPATALVLRYLSAVANGDDATARSALDGGDLSGDVQFLDPSYRLTSVSTKGAGNGDTDVEVEFRTARGQYFGTFRVDPSGRRILLHEVIPVGGTTAR